MWALWCIAGFSVALACFALVLLAKVRDELEDAVDDLDERFRDGFRAGFASAAAVQDAGLSVLRGALR